MTRITHRGFLWVRVLIDLGRVAQIEIKFGRITKRGSPERLRLPVKTEVCTSVRLWAYFPPVIIAVFAHVRSPSCGSSD